MTGDRVGIEWRRAGRCAAWLFVALCCAVAGAADTDGARAKSSSGCVRVVEDRATGLRWRVDADGGGRPNRWTLIEQPIKDLAEDLAEPACGPSGAGRRMQPMKTTGAKAASAALGASPRSAVVSSAAPVIQVGEQIVLVQTGAALEARFPAVALAAAAAGRPLAARLEIGNGGFGKRAGRVVEVTAVARGLARWDGELKANGAGW